MADPPPYPYPFTTFNFSVSFVVTGVGNGPVCGAAFAECDGLEVSMDAKTIHEGGNNGVAVRLAGPVNYGQLTLKRGMTTNFDLWSWAEAVWRTPSLRADGTITMNATKRTTSQVQFIVKRCMPVKLRAPALNAKDGIVAIEELQLVYDSLSLKPVGG